jgi:hypothetical protein
LVVGGGGLVLLMARVGGAREVGGAVKKHPGPP